MAKTVKLSDRDFSVVSEENLSKEEIVHEAIGIRKYFKDIRKSKGKVIVQTADGKIKEVII